MTPAQREPLTTGAATTYIIGKNISSIISSPRTSAACMKPGNPFSVVAALGASSFG
jgi:hypothetical protein